MTSTPQPAPVAPGELVTLLADELSEVRNRGIDLVDRENSKQKALKLPELTAILRNSEWAEEARSIGLRRLLGNALQHCSSYASKAAVRAFYGLDEYAGSSAQVRAELGLKHLLVPPNAPAGHRQLRIRELRLELARAIITAVAHEFTPPDLSDDVNDRLDEELPSPVQTLRAEFQVLSRERGADPKRIEQHAPSLLGTRGVRDQFLRDSKGATIAECAMQFLKCAVQVTAMQEAHSGELVLHSLNLDRMDRDYAYRIDKYMDEYEVADHETFLRLEAQALTRFAHLVEGLERSPCYVDPEDLKRGIEAAEHLFGMLQLMTAASAERVAAQHLATRIRGKYPDLALRVPVFAEAFAEDLTIWLKRLIEVFAREYELWVNQYNVLIDEFEQFLDTDFLVRVLVDPLWPTPPATSDRPLPVVFYERLVQQAHGDELAALFDEPRVFMRFERAKLASLVLLAQMLTYNDDHDYWLEAAKLSQVEIRDARTFPIIPIDDFLRGGLSVREPV